MKRIYLLLRLLLLGISCAIYSISTSQIIIESGPEIEPTDLVENILGDGMEYFNVQYQGADSAKGIFTDGQTTNLGIESGIILTSGMANIAIGPNEIHNSGVNNGLGGHPLLDQYTSYPTYDACILEFDFIPENDTLRFKYVFGSEDYSEWVEGAFNDVFGLFISGPDPGGGLYEDENIAVVPNTLSTPIAVNNVNNGWAEPYQIPTGPCTNCEYYSDNTFGLTLEYDGLTTVMTAWVVVIPSEQYHLLIGVADAGDLINDCGVFIAENSIEVPNIEVEIILFPEGISNQIVEGCVEADILFRLPSPEYAPVTINLDIDGTAINGVDYNEIPNTIVFEEGEDSVGFHINAYHDGMPEGEETIELIIENTLGCIVRYDTVVITILDYIDMVSAVSSPTTICEGQEVDLWVNVANGLPPYTFSWLPEPSNNDTITVSPEAPGEFTYSVTITDMCMDTVVDSTSVTVFPVCELETFYFEAYLNPGLLYDVFGDITGDTVFIVFPPGTNLNGLIPSYTFSNEECSDTVGTITDFTEPFIYQFFGPGGCMSEWIVIANVEVGQNEYLKNEIQIFPNPAKDQLTILNANGFYVSLISNVGTEVYAGEIEKQQQTIHINHLEQGIYYFQFSNEKDWLIRKVIIN